MATKFIQLIWCYKFKDIFCVLALLTIIINPAYSQKQNVSTDTYKEPQPISNLLPESTDTSTTTVKQPDLKWLENIWRTQETQRKNIPIDKALQPILDLLPESTYTSTTTIRRPDLKWFEKNIQKAQNIMEEFSASTTTWTYKDAFVAAFRFEGLCRWARHRYPKKELNLCENVEKVREFKYHLRVEHPELSEKKPWDWRFEAQGKIPEKAYYHMEGTK